MKHHQPKPKHGKPDSLRPVRGWRAKELKAKGWTLPTRPDGYKFRPIEDDGD